MVFCCILHYFVVIIFFAIYAVLSRNLICRNLRAFVWRKIEPRIVSVEKNRQISGMISDTLSVSLQFNYAVNWEAFVLLVSFAI